MSIKYELSLWRDHPGSEGIREEKIDVLAATGMDFAGRAQNIILKKEYTGKISLEFEIPVKYFDPLSGATIINPLCTKVIEKSKIKLWRDELWWNPFGGEQSYDSETECTKYTGAWEQGRWYDLVVNSHKEKRSKKQLFYSYTCSALFINELSRNGYSLQFSPDTDIMNASGMGTAHDLAARIVEGTDWQYVKTEVFPDYKEEFNAVTGETVKTPVSTDRIEFSAGLNRYCYCYELDVEDSGQREIIISIEQQLEKENLKNKIKEGTHYGFDGRKFWWKGINDTKQKNYILSHIKTDISFNGADSIIAMDCGAMRYVEDYSGNVEDNTKSRGTGVTSFTQGMALWEAGSTGTISYTTPPRDETETEFYSYLTLSANGEMIFKQSAKTPMSQGELYCVKIKTSTKTSDDNGHIKFSIVDGANKQQAFAMNINTYWYDKNAYGQTYWFTVPTYISQPNIVIQNKLNSELTFEAIYLYEFKGSSEEINTQILNLRSKTPQIYGKVSDLLRPVYPDTTLGIAPVEINVYYNKNQEEYRPIWLGMGKTTVDGYQKETYAYLMEFYDSGEYHQIYLPLNYNQYAHLTKLSSYNTDKRRSIKGEKSNRFSLIETVSKTFNCFTRFMVEHDSQGRIRLENGKPLKRFTFVSELGRRNFNGFNYGVNLESVERNIDGENLVTKCHVESISNEFSDSNMITIQDSQYNKLGMTYIYNFSYYIAKGLLNKNKFLTDYKNFTTDVGNLTRANMNKIERDKGVITQKAMLEADISTYEIMIESYKSAAAEALANIAWDRFINGADGKKGHGIKGNEKYYGFPEIKIEYLKQFKTKDNINYYYSDGTIIKKGSSTGAFSIPDGFSDVATLAQYIWLNRVGSVELDGKPDINGDQWGRGMGYNSIYNDLRRIFLLQDQLKQAQNALSNTSEQLAKLQITVDEYNNTIDSNNKEIQRKIANFERKYADYIIEGQWQGNDYIDADAYYLDATRAMSVSCMPKVSYTIGAIDLTKISNPFDPEDTEWGKTFVYNVGDTTYIKDEELFGNTEQLTMISSITSYIDTDKQDNIEMRNYETRFEELFQQVAAAITSIELNENIWSRAGGFTADGMIDPSILSKSMTDNANLEISSIDNSVKTDNTGITVTDNKTGKMIRLVGGGILLSKDGGNTYVTGITPDGINASLITVGQLDTSKIVIRSNETPNFELTSQGLTAYSAINNKITRFDQFGIYSTDMAAEFGENWWTYNLGMTPDEYISQNSMFSLTRSGLNFKYSKGGLTLGTLGQNKYGLEVKDGNGKVSIGIYDSGDAVFTGHIVATQLTLVGDAELPDIDLEGVIKIDDKIGNGNGEPSFRVTSAGLLTAENAVIKGTGVIGKWVLKPTAEGKDEYVMYAGGVGMSSTTYPSDPAFYAGYTGFGNTPWEHDTNKPSGDPSKWQDKCAFFVSNNGNAKFKGTIEATSGTIAGWSINSNTIWKDKEFVENKKTVKYRAFMQVGDNSATLSTSVFGVRNLTTEEWPFKVTYDGHLTATKATVSGTLTAGVGSKTGSWSIDKAYVLRADGSGKTTETEALISPKYMYSEYNDNIPIQYDFETYTEITTFGIQVYNDNVLTNSCGWFDLIYKVNTALIEDSSDSDLKLKTNILEYEDNYNIFFDLLKPLKYKYINGTSGRFHTGFVAQDVIEALEKANLTTQDFAGVMLSEKGTENEHWRLRRDEFVSLNTWQIQKLKARVAELERKLESLTSL